MFQAIDMMVRHIKEFSDESKRKELLRYSILAESKHNKDIAEIICRSNADKIVKKCPQIFNSFSISTSELLLMIGIPAYIILGDTKVPKENSIKEMDKSSAKYKLFEDKTPSELYEFYIRKCKTLKSLSDNQSLNSVNISLQKRCKNIGYATKSLIIKCQSQKEL